MLPLHFRGKEMKAFQNSVTDLNISTTLVVISHIVYFLRNSKFSSPTIEATFLKCTAQ